ncbi:MAG TPA: sulfite oxidase-like oxidoreductase [Chloroflexota bacterium]|nr:sulfite oxidase-like oxidoreductase [Chloroflexota bacterium]
MDIAPFRRPGPELAGRVPPGQTVTKKWPVLTYGPTPLEDQTRWTFRCFGLVERPTSWTWEAFLALPRKTVDCDIHCVTHWSLLDNQFEGVAVRDVLRLVRPKAEARFVLVHADPDDYTTNLTLEDLDRDDTLLALGHNGRSLAAEHGGPCRLLVPHLYLWKSAKWVRGFEFLGVNAPGFWEENGYHMHADPWTEERYAEQETHAMQQLRAEAARALRERSG